MATVVIYVTPFYLAVSHLRVSLHTMGIADSIRTSILGLLGSPPAPGDSTILDQAEAVRESMLAVLGEDGPADFPGLNRRIRYADDIQALWYVRSELMAALSSMYGEHKAREVMSMISDMFKDIVADAKPSKGSHRFNTIGR